MISIKIIVFIYLCFLYIAPSSTTANFVYDKGIVDKLSHCPGRYCGRTQLSNGSWSSCGACGQGTRRNASSACVQCSDQPLFYDWLYLGFMALLPLTFHLVCIDTAAKKIKFTPRVVLLYLSAIFEVIIAGVITLLVTEPMGSFNIRSCRVRYPLADWYPLLQNPNPNYEGSLHCTQEAVYPLYSMVFVLYTLCLVVLLLVRPVLTWQLLPGFQMALYSAMYFLPALIVTHAVAAGLIYNSFPYMVIIMSVVSNAAYFAFRLDQTMWQLLVGCFKDVRNLLILLGHWCLHAYGIVAITQLTQPAIHGSLCALVPLPALFYILTSRFSDPATIT